MTYEEARTAHIQASITLFEVVRDHGRDSIEFQEASMHEQETWEQFRDVKNLVRKSA